VRPHAVIRLMWSVLGSVVSSTTRMTICLLIFLVNGIAYENGPPMNGKRTPEMVAKIAEAVAIGLTDEEAALLAGTNPDTMTEWRKDPEFSGAIKRPSFQLRTVIVGEAIRKGGQGGFAFSTTKERAPPIPPYGFARKNLPATIRKALAEGVSPLMKDV
jgi:hypothetical protein